MTEKPTYAELEQRVEELRKSEKQKQIILNASLDMVMQYDTDLRIVWANKTATSVVNKSAHDIVGHYCYKIFQDRDTPCPGCSCVKALETGNVENNIMCYSVIDVAGESYWDNCAVPIKDDKGQLVGLTEIARNITHKVLAEQSLRESEEKYRILYNSSRDAIMILTPDKGFFSGNPAAVKLFGCRNEDEFISLTPAALSPEYQPDGVLSVKKAQKMSSIVMEQGSHFFEWKHKRVDGEEFYATVLLTRIKLYGEKVLQATVRDITERKKIEEERKKLEARLLQAQKMEAISTLAGGIAHQFNNGLFAITGNIDLLEMDFPGDENVADYTRKMKDSTHRMTRLTAQLLAYARGGKYQAKTISLSDFVRDTLPLVRHTIDSAISVETDQPPGIFNVNADLTQMQMVLFAVLSNAAEAMDGKGQIRIVCRNTMITDETAADFSELKPGNYISLTITDDGKGMDEETKTRIFEPFFTTRFEGRGLGMAAVYGIIKNHNGWITVDSELGKGTIVKIYLPAVQALVKEHAKPKTEPIKSRGTILVIEDGETVMKVTRKILEKMGYSVLEAKTGQEAINVAKTFDDDIDLAMLDILLPDMSGDAIYPFLMEACPDLKVIVFSGYSADGPVQEILNAGAEDFIQKPFSVAELSEKLKKALGSEN